MSFWDFAGNVVGAFIGSKSNDKATDQYNQYAEQALGLQQDQFEWLKQILAPQIEMSDWARNQARALLDPNYSFIDGQGYYDQNQSVQDRYGALTPEKRAWLIKRGADTNNDGQISAQEFGTFDYNWKNEHGTLGDLNAPVMDGAGMIDAFRATPMQQAVERDRKNNVAAQLSGMGLNESGSALRAYDDLEYNNVRDAWETQLNSLFGLAGGGATATAANAGQNFANASGNILQNLGMVNASSYGNNANLWGNAIGSGFDWLDGFGAERGWWGG